MSNFKASEIDEWVFLMDVWRELNDLSLGFSMNGIGLLSSLSVASQQCKQA